MLDSLLRELQEEAVVRPDALATRFKLNLPSEFAALLWIERAFVQSYQRVDFRLGELRCRRWLGS